MRVAQIVTDFRESLKLYGSETPRFHASVQALLSGFAAQPGTEVHVLACYQERLASPETLFPNVFFHPLHVRKTGWLRTGYQGCIRAVRRTLREVRPDIVHGQGTERYGALAAVFSGQPNVVTVRGNMRQVARALKAGPFSYHGLAARLERLTLPRAGGIVCISEYTRRQVEPLNRRTWLVPNAAEPEFFELARRPENNLVVCIGDIVPYKNQVALMKALDPLASRKPFEMVLAGRMGNDAYAAEFRRELQARPWCSYLESADREGVKRLLSTATALVHPTLEDNSPLAVIEALAAGVPVAASRIGGIPDLIEHEVNGLLFNPADPSDLSDAVERLCESPSLRQRLSAAAKARAEERHRPAAVARRHMEIYEELLTADNADFADGERKR